MRVYLLLLFPFCAFAQNEPAYNAGLIPPVLRENADAVVRSQQITLSVSAPDEAVLREKRVVTLFNDKSNYDELALVYSSMNKIGKIRGSIFDADGNFIRDVEKNEIEDYSAAGHISTTIYEDYRLRYLNVGYEKFPYTVVFDYEIKYRDLPTGYPGWTIQKYNTSVEQSSFEVIMPEKIKLFHKTLNTELAPIATNSGNKRHYLWKVENLPAIKSEPYTPSSYEILPSVLVSPGTFKADNYEGSMASWKEFGQFQYDLARGRDALSPALKAKVLELTTGVTSDAGKIAVLYRYLQENTRYVSVQLGIGGWQPFDAQYVEKNKYGDCKALSNFMKALLHEAGIEAYPAVVMAGDFFDLPDDFATSAFNHMILYVPSQDTWLECTSNSFPPNYLGNFTGDRKVLIISEQGGKLVRTPAFSPADNTANRHTEITITASGGAIISKQSTLNGPAHEWYRNAVDDLSPDELKKEMQKGCPLPQAYFTQLFIRPQKETPTVRVEYTLDVPQFGSKAGKRLFLPANPVNAYRDVPPANEKRIHPVEVRGGYTELDTIVLHLPEGYAIESIPAENTHLATEFGSYTGQFIHREAEGILLFVRRLEMKPIRLPAARYGEWRNFCRDVAKADGAKVVLIQKT